MQVSGYFVARVAVAPTLRRRSLADRDLQIGVEPQAYLTDVITPIVAGHQNGHLDEFLPWSYRAVITFKVVTENTSY